MKGKTSICSFPIQFTERCDWPVSIIWSVEIGVWAQWRIQWQGREGHPSPPPPPPPLFLDQTEAWRVEKNFWEIGPLIISGSGWLPEQLRPSPKYPSLQTHSKDPAVFVQVPFTWQSCLSSLHSSASVGSERESDKLSKGLVYP